VASTQGGLGRRFRNLAGNTRFNCPVNWLFSNESRSKKFEQLVALANAAIMGCADQSC
jgi:hypothetical protein